MRVILARPNYHSHLITPPLGLGYLSSYLRQRGYETKIIDGLNEAISDDEIVRKCQGYDLVGISCMSDYFLEVISLTKKLKGRGLTVVIGGAHASALPEFTLEQTGADYVIVGEGEVSLFELVKKIADAESTEGLAGVVTKENGHFTKRQLIGDIDSLPFPDWEQMDPRRYKKAPHGGLIRNFPVAPIVSTRGCPFSCSFCTSPTFWGGRVRFRSPEKVVEEIAYLKENFGIKEIHFEDDNLTLSKGHLQTICQLIMKKRIRISWAVPNGIRVDTVDSTILRMMKESGCYYLAFGIESANPSILERVKKEIDLKVVEDSVWATHNLGMLTQGFFIFGLPGETRETIQNTIKFAKSIPLDRAQFLLLDVLPGSELWDELKDEMDIAWNRRSYQEVTWIPNTIDRDILQSSAAYAFRSFFFRPRQIVSLIRYFKLYQLRFVLRRLIDFNLFPGRKKKETKM